MLKTVFKKFNFIIGIVLGIAVAIACSTTADSILNALDVLFDNSDTSLSTNNVQNAITELDQKHETIGIRVIDLESNKLPKVFDANGNFLGIWTSLADIYKGISLYNAAAKGNLILEQTSPTVQVYTRPLYYTSTDCTGTAYVPQFSGPFLIFENASLLYRGRHATGSDTTMNSNFWDSSGCTTESDSGIFYEAENVSTNFTLPIIGPLDIKY